MSLTGCIGVRVGVGLGSGSGSGLGLGLGLGLGVTSVDPGDNVTLHGRPLAHMPVTWLTMVPG